MQSPIPPPTAPAAAPASASGGAGLPTFIRELLGRYSALRAADAGRRDITAECLAELQLAEAALRVWPADPARPRQVVVLGPTQVGKSTVVNLLLGCDAAGVSPLAGFTVHAQGFLIAGALAAGWTATIFPGWPRAALDRLTPDRLEEYGLVELHAADRLAAAAAGRELADAAGGLVLWDSPDFDSLRAQQYQRAVLELAAVGDVFVLVLSKEKYSDESAWSMLRLLEPLGRPLVIALNKLTPDSAGAIEQSLRMRIREQIPNWKAVELVTIPLVVGLAAEPHRALPEAAAGLQAAVSAALHRADRRRATAGVRHFARRRWNPWIAPLRNEHAAADAWRNEVDAALLRLVEAYRNEYLDHPQRFDSFRRATVELLQLLELPGVGRTLGKVRNVVTWPARKLFSAGQSWWLARRGARHTPTGDEEILADVVGNLLTGLRAEAARRAAGLEPAAAFWAALGARLEAEEQRIRRTIGEAIRQHQHRVAQEIHAAANQLYEILRERPALLNTLRGARVTADAASILLAIKTGGAHLNDVLIAPAMFGLVSLMTEGAVGAYMTRIADDLKQRQLANVRTALVDGLLAPTLRGLVVGLSGPRLVGLTPERLDAATAALEDWERRPHE